MRITYSPSGISVYFSTILTINCLVYFIDRLHLHILRRIPLVDVNFYKCIYSDDAYLAE